MKTIALFLRVLVGLAILSLFSAQGAQKAEMSPDEHRQALRDVVASLLSKYQDTKISESSPDYALFEIIGNEARTSQEFVEALIILTAIQDVRPNTTEKLSLSRLSPAARELKALGDIADGTVRSALERPSLTSLQRKLLHEVISSNEGRKRLYSGQPPSNSKQMPFSDASVVIKSGNLEDAKRVWHSISDNKPDVTLPVGTMPKDAKPSLLNGFGLYAIIAAILAGIAAWLVARLRRGSR